MKKYLLLACSLLSFAALRAQVFTHPFSSSHIHVTAHDSLYHDSTSCNAWINVQYQINVDTSFVGDALNLIDSASGTLMSHYVNTAGTIPWILTIPGGTNGWGDEQMPVGGGYWYPYHSSRKITTGIDTLRSIITYDSLWVLPCLYGTVDGRYYIDNNTNCTYDAGDGLFNSMYPPTINELLSSPYPYTSRDYNYTYNTYSTYYILIQKSWMTSYTVTLPPAYAFIFPMSPCFSATYTFTTLPQSGVDFPLLCSSNVDVQCGVLNTGRVRRLTPFFLHPYVSNTGCDTMSGTMTLVKDSRVAYDASLSANPATTVHGDTLIWNYSHLTSLSSGAYWNSFMSGLYLSPDSSLVSGDTICFRVYTNIPPSDVNPFNNDYSICIPVVYSYDPNSKEVSPAGTGTDGKLPANTNQLTYTINFQNTGTDVAYNVKVIDTLDSHLDPHSLKILGTSHNMIPKWLTPNVVEFDYANIMLPDSTHNEPKSHGQVQFSVNLRSGLPVGTHLSNTGYIYFDTNPAVITNTTYNTTSLPSATPQVTLPKEIKIYPNPATDQITVEGVSSGDISILNMSGSVIIKQHIASDKTMIDISRLPGGVYMMKTVNDANTSTSKFTKY